MVPQIRDSNTLAEANVKHAIGLAGLHKNSYLAILKVSIYLVKIQKLHKGV